MLFATDRGLLENTIDRIDAGSSASSLYENERFQEARKAGPSPRFSMLYVDTESIWTDVRRTFGAELPSELRDRISDFVPQWATLTTSFIDNGMKFTVSSPISEEVHEGDSKDLSLSATQLLPKDTLALLAFAVGPSLGEVREQLRDQRIEDLGPEFYDGLFQLGLGISWDDSSADVLDAVLKTLKDAFGVDLERDILDWMSGELAFALLPINFRALSADPQTEAVNAAVFIQFDIAKRDAVTDGLEHLLDSIQEGLGFAPDAVSYGGGEGAVFDLSESIGISPYRPGYLILDDQLLIATTEDPWNSLPPSAKTKETPWPKRPSTHA